VADPGETANAAEALAELRADAARCIVRPLYANATQTVFGEGPADARLMLVGEQPGDAEDLAGHPFVGPAGRLLDRCLVAARIDRGRVWVTNIVKHFKWVPRGKRRLHSKPGAVEIAACLPWLEGEIRAIRPLVVVALGATAARGMFGKAFRVTRERGRRALRARPLCAGDGAPVGIAAGSRRRHAAARDRAFCRGPA